MKAILTSYLGGTSKVNGIRVPSVLVKDNGLLDTLQTIWPDNANVLIICSDPDNYEKNDQVCDCLSKSFPMSGLSISKIDKCDNRNIDVIENLNDVDVLLLAGGHVPTQNLFMHKLKLKERLETYHGLVIAWSAGSMNCADIVYASPELDGEAIDPNYKRWLPGLGLTKINIFPHYQELKEDFLDGLRIIEDITFADSFIHEVVATPDGSYIIVDDDRTVLYGEAYLIKNGTITQICANGESIEFEKDK